MASFSSSISCEMSLMESYSYSNYSVTGITSDLVMGIDAILFM